MGSRALRRLVGLAFFAGSGLAWSAGDWQGIPFGATQAEVAALGKEMGITPLGTPQRPPSAGPDADYVPLEIPSYEIGGKAYRVAFIFDGKSHQLKHVGVESKAADGKYRFDSLRVALTEKYGAPRVASTSGIVWHDSRARINLGFIDTPGGPWVGITYSPPTSAIDSKL